MVEPDLGQQRIVYEVTGHPVCRAMLVPFYEQLCMHSIQIIDMLHFILGMEDFTLFSTNEIHTSIGSSRGRGTNRPLGNTRKSGLDVRRRRISLSLP